ncbi:DUF5937 family protein [Lentzea sp. NPDC058436]|uniref:ArsR/SmtB family transcription factor n=1 Tax=Lentzea sp. NPDC058436 TaxID=3346499 RepID=UPI00365FF38F
MSVLLRLHGVRPAEVTARCSVVAELMACLHVLAEPEHHPDRTAWARRVIADLPAPAAADCVALAPLWARFRTRLLLPLESGGAGDLDAELGRISELDLGEFVQMAGMAVFGLRQNFRWPLDDAASAQEFVRACAERSTRRGVLAAELVADPERLRGRLIGLLLGASETFFGALWQRVRPSLERSAERVGASLRTEPLPLVIGSLAANSVIDVAEHTVEFSKLQQSAVSVRGRGLVLVPSHFGRPHLLVKDDKVKGRPPQLQPPVVVQYPAEQHGPRGADTLDKIRERLLVLTDAGRLEICRHLINEQCTTTELAWRTGMTQPQVSRHLRRLREVGLVESARHGRTVQHRIQTSRLYGIGYDLVAGIVG